MDQTNGRPTVMTPEALQKLEEAFLLGCTDEEACLHAGISVRTLYNHQHLNEDFLQRKELLKQNPFLIARKTILKGLEKDPRLALMFMERKKKGEFSIRHEYTDNGGAALMTEEAVKEVLRSLEKL